MSDLNQAKRQHVNALDAKCERCFKLPENEMLCSGMRLYIDNDATQLYGTEKFVVSPCNKLQVKQSRDILNSKFAESGIPGHEITKILKEFKEDGIPDINVTNMVYYIDSIAIPMFVHEISSIEMTRFLWRYLVLLQLHQYKVKYIHPLHWYYNEKVKTTDDFTSLDCLVVDRVDLSLFESYKSDMFYEAISQRILAGRHTVVTTKDNKKDTDLLKEISTWKQFPKL